MERIKEAIEIIKSRWEEVALIFGLFLLSLIALAVISPTIYTQRNLQAGESLEFDGKTVLYAVFSAVTLLFCYFLFIGFVRTAFVSGGEEKSVGELVKTGMRFFWRLVAFLFFYNLVQYVFQAAGLTIAESYFQVESIEASNPRVVEFIRFISVVVLIKPAILIPAIIIVLNCRLLESFGFLRQMRLTDSKELIVLFVIQVLIAVLFPFIEQDREVWYYLLGIVPRFAVYFINFLIFIIATRFVGSYNFEQADLIKWFKRPGRL